MSDPVSNLDPRSKALQIDYTNHAGERRKRLVVPLHITYVAAPPWHPEPQWIMVAWDAESDQTKSFAMANIHEMVNTSAAPTVAEPT